MLYSESKERGNRFLIALKIGFPFLILILYIFFASKENIYSIILFTILIPIYIYYIFYLIYNGFKTTLIDKTTRTFDRKEIINLIDKEIKKRKKSTIILINIENISDINSRYGENNADNLLREFVKKLNNFLINYNFKNIPIGRYRGGSFLLIINHKAKELKHFMTIFSKELKNIGINNIEIKISFSLIESNYDEDVENIIKKLFDLIAEQKDTDFNSINIKPDVFENIVQNAIKEEKFFYKFQPGLNLKKNRIEIYEVLTKIYSKEYGLISKNHAKRAINLGGFEKIFDEKMFNLFLEQIKNINFDDKLFCINVSASTIRDNGFRIYLRDLFHKKNMKIKNIILDINEKQKYEDIKRFNEILIQYKKAGFMIGLENFGGDNCSIEYLKNLPIDIVKFDISYTKYIDNQKYATTLKNLIELCNSLHVKSMVKFVDKEEVFNKIKEFNPTYIQGFYISKPKTLNQITGDKK